eukprot:m.414381 g.414381  ORF g.414381 m.414381 type:complete len:268 (-) comp21271_c0_seq2:1307-2110(-)
MGHFCCCLCVEPIRFEAILCKKIRHVLCGSMCNRIGAALAAGFAFMLVVDKIAAGSTGHGHHHSGGGGEDEDLPTKVETRQCGGNDMGELLKRSTSFDVLSAARKASSQKNSGKRRNSAAMLGLMVHAAIDGVALGASTFAGNTTVSLVIFSAIMLHKAPAAFGLSSFLSSTGENKRVVAQNLLIFSLAAPVGAFATFGAMYMGVMEYQLRTLALVMLFSGGTFLFVATVHIMPDVLASGVAMTWLDVVVNVAGILLPMCINFEHGH